MGRRGWLFASIVASVLPGVAVFLLPGAETPPAGEEKLTRYRNLGKAFYENPTTQAQAVDQFLLAYKANPRSLMDRLNYGLALLRAAKTKEGMAELEAVQKADPKIPHTWFNLGIELKKQGETDRAIAQLEEMARLAPGEPITQYNLGVLYKLAGRGADALAKFEAAAKLDHTLAAPHFQLFNAYRQSGRAEDAKRELAAFQEIKKLQEASGNTEDVEWSLYSEVYEVIDAAHADEKVASAALRFVGTAAAGAKVDAGSATLQVLDLDGDGGPDLLAVSAAGVAGWRRALTPMDLGIAVPGKVLAVAAGDFDNDGLVDLCVLTSDGAALYRNAKGKFERVEAAIPAGTFTAAAWLDYDHDYDLDLLLFSAGKNVLLRNQGQAGFADRTADFPFVTATPVETVNLRLIPDSKALDLLVSYGDKPPVLYRDRLGGRYEATSLNALPGGMMGFQAADLNNDSYLDLVFRSRGGSYVAFNKGGVIGAPEPMGRSGEALALGDWENRGLTDLVQAGQRTRNLGQGRWELARAVAGLPSAAAAWAAWDFDSDGKLDVAAVLPDGSVQRYLNRSVLTNTWLRVGLTGIKNLKLAPGSEVEIKAGLLYQKRIYTGVPLLFGMRGSRQADTIRITWPNGLIQNEMRQLAGKPYEYKEAQRLSGSCPVIWTWNGTEFEYITDVLGVAPLGASSGDGKFFPTDSDEYISIAGGSLKARDGKLEVRVTEELSEVSYLDRVQLIAVDHPAAVEVFSNDKWKAPPFPEFRLFGAARRVYPVKARDEAGRDVTAQVVRKDRRYPDGFPQNLNGVAAMHHLDLDFGAQAARSNRAVLILNGWVDWADGSTFLAQAQESKQGLVPPQLQVKDKQGRWVTVLEDMGMPAGKPKTIAVDLTSRFPSESREIRIVTNLCVFWDEIFLSEDSGAPEVRMTALDPAKTDLRFRGFSETLIDPQRKQPEQFFYREPLAASLWNPTPGYYTRYGEVSELLAANDDRLVVMGSGDEVQLLYDEAKLPALKAGWKRDYLLKVEGWAKDRDANTAHSQTVEPLPFHKMTSYPYPGAEQYPDDEFHREYRKQYNTRPALRILRPLHVAGTQSRSARP